VTASDVSRVAQIPVAGGWRETGQVLTVRNPFDGEVVAEVARAGASDVEDALASAHAAFEQTRRIPAHQRSRVLAEVSSGIADERETLARTLTLQTGKTIRDARVEVDRATMTFAVAAEEAKRVGQEVVPMDWAASGEGRFAVNRRFPIGLVVGISPFNFPLNLVAHKMAPAIAAGNPIVVKPASQTPTPALQLAYLIREAGWPAEALSVVTADSSTFEPVLTDPRVKKITFTGSMDVGWRLKRLAWRKKVTLELGGNAGCIVAADADIDHAVARIVAGGFSFSGQSCISVQRVYVARAIWDEFVEKLVTNVEGLEMGNPINEETDIGPMIDTGAADRVMAWLDEAYAGGAKALLQGRREGNVISPTILVDAQPEMKVCAREVFAPIINLFPFDDFGDAVRAVDNSIYGLQAGLFTRDVRQIFQAYEGIEVGGLMVNEVPSWRIDNMPYGGVKESGWGREGLRYAIEEMTEPRLLVMGVR
jgi:glyceraldehyde-3-phosphate dehydrogenase (NADP+)